MNGGSETIPRVSEPPVGPDTLMPVPRVSAGVRVIPIARPSVGEEERQALLEVLESGVYAQGPKVAAFEKAFGGYLGRRHAVMVSSGTAALHLAQLAAGIGKGDQVVMPPLTFFACLATTVHCGATPRFADVDPEQYTIDPEKVRKAVTKRTGAIMPVHLYGQTAEMAPILDLAKERDVVVIEDACQAHGAEYHGRKAGRLGDAACFSFYPTKNMTTGEGGAVVTDDRELAAKVRMLRDQGQVAKYDHAAFGYNLRMTEFAAALGLVQLRKLDAFVRARRENAAFLTRAIERIDGLAPPIEGNWMLHAYYQYIVRVEKGFPLRRDEVVRRLKEKGIGARPSYPKVVYNQPAAVAAGLRGRCSVAQDLVPRLFELPVHPLVSLEERNAIAGALEGLA